MEKIGVLSVQINPKLGDKEYNLKKVYSVIEQYCDKELDLIVLPEFFSTGLCDKTMINEPEDTQGGMVVEFLAKAAKRFNTNIVCGSVIEKDGENLYNTAFVLDRQGNIVTKYRKIHLFNYFGGNEGTYTTAGNEPVVANLDFGKVGVSLCFDIKYPLLYKKLIQMGAEIIVSPSAWSNLSSLDEKAKEEFVNTWRAMNICRATESLVYFVTSNLVAQATSMLYSTGNSMIVSPYGSVLQNAGMLDGGIYSQIDLNIVREFKKTVPVASMD